MAIINGSVPGQPEIESVLLNAATNLVAAVLILIASWVFASWSARWTLRALSRLARFGQTLTPLVADIMQYAIIAIGVIAVLQRVGMETTSLIAVLGTAGLSSDLHCRACSPMSLRG
jgi:small conductance mechanosensitive channel